MRAGNIPGGLSVGVGCLGVGEDKIMELRSHWRLDTTPFCCSKSVFCRLEIQLSAGVLDYNVQGPRFHPLHGWGGAAVWGWQWVGGSAGDKVQLLECLLSMHGTLGLSLSTA